MILVLDSPAIAAYVAVAIRRQIRELRRDGLRVPPELAQLAEALLASGAVPGSPEASPLASSPPEAALLPRMRMVSLAAAAKTLGVSPSTARRAVAAGDLGTVRMGRRVLVPLAELERFVREGQAGGH